MVKSFYKYGLCLLLVVTLLWASGCKTVPVTGRSQLNLLPESTLNSMSVQSYEDFLAQSTLSDDAAKTALVNRVGLRIKEAVETYGERHDLDFIEDYEWEFNLVQDENVNAFAMPGGKVVVFTGILPITRDETGLAVVMGHEVAHVIARHGNERMSQAMITELGGMALSQAVSKQPGLTQKIFKGAYGMGTQYGLLLPYSRLHESEADHLGLIFMAMAGYDPQEAPAFWQRMSEVGGQKPPEFLSTHPADDTRIEDLHEIMPDAMAYYQPAAGGE